MPAPDAMPGVPGGRFAQLPSSLQRLARTQRLGKDGVPALLAHPDWETPAPTVLWMHGRTVHKELDPGRYLRLVRAGIAVCAIDLPGHGERYEDELQLPDHTLRVVEQGVREVDGVLAALQDPAFGGVFDASRLGIGGMSAGGMVTLRRLGDEHPFVCAAVESTAGDFSHMPRYFERYEPAFIEAMNPIAHVSGWRPIPLLALHSEADEWVPVEAIRSLVAALEGHYAGAAPLTLRTWPETGAPFEHAGFGRVANDAKNEQVDFFRRSFGLA